MLGCEVFPETLSDYYSRIARMLAAPETVVFLDTNILAYPYKLFAHARQELLDWLRGLDERLVVPAWAASEYFTRLRSQKLKDYGPPFAQLGQAKAALESAVDLAGLFVDGDWVAAKFPGSTRETFLAVLRAEAAPVASKLEALSKRDGRDSRAIHNEVSACLLPRVARTARLPELCERANSTGGARFQHRIPPGYGDASKQENRYGDLILWLEIIELAQARAECSQFLLVTNDESKSDWSYSPPLRKSSAAGANSVEGNRAPELRLTDPRLQLEFERGVRLTATIEVVSIKHIIAAQSRASAAGFRHLATALQLEEQQQAEAEQSQAELEHAEPEHAEPEHAEPERAEPDRAEPEQAGSEPAEPDDAEPQNKPRYSVLALRDADYVPQTSAIDDTITKLRGHNWYVQNPVIKAIPSLARTPGLTPDALFVLGRNVYQAACGNAFDAMAFLEQHERRLQDFDQAHANDIVAGIAYEAYFDKHGALRHLLKAEHFDRMIRILESARYEVPKEWLLEQLKPHRDRLAWLPGEERDFNVRLFAVPIGDSTRRAAWELGSLTINGTEAIEDGESLRSVSRLDSESILRLLAEHYGIPSMKIELAIEPAQVADSAVWWPDSKRLRPWRALA